MKRLFDWLERNARPVEGWIGILFFALLFVWAVAVTAAGVMGYFG